MKTIGSQKRELLADTDMEILRRISDTTVALQDKETGELEMWVMSDDFAGYVIEIDGKGYEFASSIKE